jgi:hypothetical protein
VLYGKLTDKQRIFANENLLDLNATRAYKVVRRMKLLDVSNWDLDYIREVIHANRYNADKKWAETGINWNDASIDSKKLGEMVISNADSNKWIELDITDYIKENISDDIVSLILINENGTNSKFKHAK